MLSARAILFDVGGPLDTEVAHEQQLDASIRAEFGAAGLPVNDADYAVACRLAVECFAPNSYQAIIWHLSAQNAELARRVYDAVWRQAGARSGIELRPAVSALLEELSQRGLLLGLAANQPRSMLTLLDAAGIGRFFQHREVSGSHGFHKPDPRLFLRACAELGVEPTECVMVGDRIDNDMAPARGLGMRTILFRTGRHRAQQPRSWLEVPDAEVEDVDGLRAALLSLLL